MENNSFTLRGERTLPPTSSASLGTPLSPQPKKPLHSKGKVVLKVALAGMLVFSGIPVYSGITSTEAYAAGAVAPDKYTITSTATAPADANTIYTEFGLNGKGNSDRSGNGTKSNPYNRFEDAVKYVADGGTIIITSSGQGAFINSLDESGHEPFVINKNVTIKSDSTTTQASLVTRAAGLILGGNVTFENVKIQMANKYHAGIFANGYDLTLNNVGHDSSYRDIDVFAGGLYLTSGELQGVTSGTSANTVTVKGNCNLRNVYGGSLNGTKATSSTITIDKASSLTIGSVFASGADETVYQMDNWFDFTEVDPPTANPTKHTVTGSVTFNVGSNKVRTLDGAGTTEGSTLNITPDGSSFGMTATKIDNLNVKSGLFAPLVLTAGNNNAINLTLPANSTLELDALSNKDAIPTFGSLTGGGNLIISSAQSLTFTGAVTGTTTLFTGKSYDGTSQYGIPDKTYITTPVNTPADSFSYIPNSSQAFYSLDLKTDVSWVLTNNSTDEKLSLDGLSFEPDSDSKYLSELRATENKSGPKNSLTVKLNYDSVSPEILEEFNWLDRYDINFTVKKDGIDQPIVVDQSYFNSVRIPSCDLEVYLVDIEKDGESASLMTVFPTCMDSSGQDDSIRTYADKFTSGVYEITASYSNSDGSIASASYTLTVTDDPQDNTVVTTVPTTMTLTSSGTNTTIGEEIVLTATPSTTDASTTLSGTVQFYLNNKPIGNAVTLTNGKATTAVTLDTSNSTIGTNSITAVFKATNNDSDKLITNTSASTTITVNKLEPLITKGEDSTTTYNGTGVVVTPNVTTANGIDITPTVIYKNEKGVESEVAPTTPGTYTTTISVPETAYSTAASVAGPTITIEKADTTTSGKVETNGSTSATTATVTVAGVGGVKPCGTVVIKKNGTEVGTATVIDGTATCNLPSGAVGDAYTFEYKDGTGLYKNSDSDQIVAAEQIRTISVKAISNVTYNGATQKLKPTVTDTDGNPATENTDYTLSWSGDTKNAGTVTVTVTGKGNFTGTQKITYKILPRAVTLTSKSQTRAYNGKALTSTAVTVSGAGFVKGEATAKATGSITKMGSVKNTIKVTATSTAYKASNYTFTYNTGTLKITRPTTTATSPVVSYRTHVQSIGWQGWKSNKALSGTTGKSKRLEAINIKLSNLPTTGGITYRTHVQTYGWQGWKSNGALSGTTGKKKRLEAIQIKLTGNMAKEYDIYYRVHAQKFGWMGWAKNGASAGTAGYSYRLEAIQIVLVPKGGKAPGSTANTFRQKKK